MKFPLPVVVTAYTGVQVCTFEDLRTFLNYMTGHDLFIREIPRARKAVAFMLAQQYPFLRRISLPSAVEPRGKGGQTPAWMREISKQAGAKELDVDRLPAYQPHPVSLAGL